jgi:L-ascorbate metabolism protein UlaG (beta-lactamase superfamily)
MPAAYRPAAETTMGPAAGSVRLTYLGHSSFLIESAQGVRAVTDYNGVDRPPEPPAVVTMNNAHETHYTDLVGPEIEHVLRGWDPDGGIAEHDVTIADLHVRNVPTNVRAFGGTRYNGNSIFVFELADLCIAHLGHLHHVLSDAHLGELGMIDILLVPVDGSYTIAQELMLEVLDQIAAPLIIPMHFFSEYTLARFLNLVEGRYEVVIGETSSVTLSRMTLPYRKVLVLPAG